MKTPLTLFFELGGYTLSSDFCQEWIDLEKEFAKQFFNQGMSYMIGEHELFEQTHSNFEQFYSQYES